MTQPLRLDVRDNFSMSNGPSRRKTTMKGVTQVKIVPDAKTTSSASSFAGRQVSGARRV